MEARGDPDAKHMSPARALVRGKRLKWALILAIDSVLRPPYVFSFREFAAPCPSAQTQHHEIPGVLRVAMRATSFVEHTMRPARSSGNARRSSGSRRCGSGIAKLGVKNTP